MGTKATPDFKQRFRALTSVERQPILDSAPTVRGDETTAVLRLYDPIDSWGGPWGVSAKEFVGVLDELPSTVDTIRLLINSPGGEVFEGMAILAALQAHPARVVAVVEGLAASAASFVAVGADEVVMAKNAELMIHDAWGLAVGNADDMRTMAGMLDRISDNIASVYADKAGGKVATWRAVMTAETWYSAAEAVKAGLADRIDKKAADPAAKNRFDLSIFNFAGRHEAPGPQFPATDPASGFKDNLQGGSAVDFSDEQLNRLRQHLALEASADADAILAAVEDFRPLAFRINGTESQDVVAVQAHIDGLEARPEVAAFNVAGQSVSDHAAVQAHITQLEANAKAHEIFAKETRDANRKAFVAGLATANKIAGKQVESLTEHAQGLTEDQYAAFVKTYDEAPANPLFAKFTPDGGGTPDGQAETVAAMATLEATIDQHRRAGLSTEQIENTDSFKRLQALKSAAAHAA